MVYRKRGKIFLKASALSFRPFVLAGWIMVFTLSGSSGATDEIRSYMVNGTKKPIWVQSWSPTFWRCFSYKGNCSTKFYNVPINSLNAYLPSPAMCNALYIKIDKGLWRLRAHHGTNTSDFLFSYKSWYRKLWWGWWHMKIYYFHIFTIKTYNLSFSFLPSWRAKREKLATLAMWICIKWINWKM